MTLPLISDRSRARGGEPLEPETFERLFESAGAVLAVLDADARFIAVNPACRTVLGHDPDELVGLCLLDLARPQSPIGGGGRKGSPLREGADGRTVELLARHRHADGSWRWLLWSGAVRAGRWYAAARDVTDWIRLEDRVGRDPLTQLPNREAFIAEVTHALARHAESGRSLAVLFIDIDQLKQINDSIGHEAGDRLVAAVAERLRLAVRTGDVVGRLGGDEFGIVVESLGDEQEAVTVAQRALDSLHEPLEVGGATVAVSASIGVSAGQGSQATAESLIHEADLAMYKAKAAGRNGFAMFDAKLRAHVERRRGLERDLESALAEDQLTLDYEPIVRLADGCLVGFEGSLRWQHPTRGAIDFADFMPLADKSGVSVELGVQAFRTAAAQVARWRAGGHGDAFVGLAVTPRQLVDDEFIAGVRSVIEECALPPFALGVEVAENAALTDPARTIGRLGMLRGLGMKVAYDNFGAGYSSLQHLVQLPVDAIKLDRAHVASLTAEDPRAGRAVVVAVVAAARELGIRVVAEGVDDPRTLALVAELGCDAAQGRAFGDPQPARSVEFAGHAAAVRGALAGR